MEGLVPPAVVVAEGDMDGLGEADLLPEEAALVVRAVEKRRREFGAGRACARRALAVLGLPVGPILSGGDREPLWPAGVTGSITHCAGYCAAAVGWRREVGSIGIDAEVYGPLPDGVEGMVCTEAERAWIRGMGDRGVEWGMVVFSAKESVYKAWYPIARRWLGFEEAELAIDPGTRTFTARLAVRAADALGDAGSGVRGRFAVVGSRVATCAVIPW